MVDYLGRNTREITALPADTTAASLARDLPNTSNEGATVRADARARGAELLSAPLGATRANAPRTSSCGA
jgi:hypothetical protein